MLYALGTLEKALGFVHDFLELELIKVVHPTNHVGKCLISLQQVRIHCRLCDLRDAEFVLGSKSLDHALCVGQGNRDIFLILASFLDVHQCHVAVILCQLSTGGFKLLLGGCNLFSALGNCRSFLEFFNLFAEKVSLFFNLPFG